LPEEMEVQLSRLVADAGGQLSQQKQAMAAQQAAAQQAQDPVMQMRQQELQIKGAEVQRKVAKDASETQLAQERLNLDKSKAMATQAIEAERIDSQRQQADRKSDIDAAKTLLDMAKDQMPRGRQ
jgi:hypothetical protein